MHPMCIQTRKLPASQYHRPSHIHVGLPVTILTADFASGTNLNPDTLGLGVMAGVCGLRMLHGRNRTLTKSARVSKQDKFIERIDIATHTTDDAASFKVQPTDAMEDDWCRVISLTRVTFRRVIKTSPGPRSWLGKC